jgi:uncharacterized protein YdeI (YjbR/CyaY-like superfamily)
MVSHNSITPTFFATQHAFRAWLMKHHNSETELVVGFYKVGCDKPSITWSQSVDQALCFGWIDGVRKAVDSESYCIRFTPRKASSIWSAINIKKVEELTAKGLMQPAGLKAFSLRKEDKSRVYSHENETAVLSPEMEQQFKKNTKAWNFFQTQAPSYKKVALHWLMSAKQAKTRLTRLEKLMQYSAEAKRVF